MAMRSVAAAASRSSLHRAIDEAAAAPSASLFSRYFSDGKRILSEEERAKETVYIQVSFSLSLRKTLKDVNLLYSFRFYCWSPLTTLSECRKIAKRGLFILMWFIIKWVIWIIMK